MAGILWFNPASLCEIPREDMLLVAKPGVAGVHAEGEGYKHISCTSQAQIAQQHIGIPDNVQQPQAFFVCSSAFYMQLAVRQ